MSGQLADEKLTGRCRHRTMVQSFFGFRKRQFMVLQVEVHGLHGYGGAGYYDSEYVTRWRDASVSDLTCSPRPPMVCIREAV